jgi:hypothetical protein
MEIEILKNEIMEMEIAIKQKKQQIKLLKKEKSAKKIFVFEEASEKQKETHLKRIENGKKLANIMRLRKEIFSEFLENAKIEW